MKVAKNRFPETKSESTRSGPIYLSPKNKALTPDGVLGKFQKTFKEQRIPVPF